MVPLVSMMLLILLLLLCRLSKALETFAVLSLMAIEVTCEFARVDGMFAIETPETLNV